MFAYTFPKLFTITTFLVHIINTRTYDVNGIINLLQLYLSLDTSKHILNMCFIRPIFAFIYLQLYNYYKIKHGYNKQVSKFNLLQFHEYKTLNINFYYIFIETRQCTARGNFLYLITLIFIVNDHKINIKNKFIFYAIIVVVISIVK